MLYVGHVLSAAGLHTDRAQIEAVKTIAFHSFNFQVSIHGDLLDLMSVLQGGGGGLKTNLN